MSEWPLHSFLELAALPTAVPCARLHAKHVVWEWGLGQLSDDVELIVSEIVTNAVQATAALEKTGRSGYLAGVPCIELMLFSDKDQVRIEVWDGHHQPPEPRALGSDGVPALGDEEGRGLHLVDALSRDWGYYRTPVVEPQETAVSAEGRWAAPAVSRSRGLRMMGKVVWAVVA